MIRIAKQLCKRIRAFIFMDQILIRFLNSFEFRAVLIASGSKFQIFYPWKL